MTIDAVDVAARACYGLITIYMILILLRWMGPWLELDLRNGWWRLIPQTTDPVLKPVRAVMPSIGPMDFAPLATVLGLWFIRTILVGMLVGTPT